MPTALDNFLNSPSYSVTLRDLAKVELRTESFYTYASAMSLILQYVMSTTKASWLSSFTLYDYVNLFSEVSSTTALTEAANLTLKIDTVLDLDNPLPPSFVYFFGTTTSFPSVEARQKEYFKFIFSRSSKIPESVALRTQVACLWYLLSPADIVIKLQILGNRITILYTASELT